MIDLEGTMKFKFTPVLALLVAISLLAPACKKKAEKPPVAQKPVETGFGPVVAGSFYPSDPVQLKSMIEGFLAAAKAPEPALSGRLIAVMSPHAGYQYSGPVAAYAFKAIQASGKKKFVIIAPSHSYSAPESIGVLDMDYYQTPLGKVKINRQKTQQLLTKGAWVISNTKYFDQEHAAEVMLPFLQVAVGNDIEVVMVVMPDPRIEMDNLAASALKEVFTEPSWVFIASSDMSHYHPDKDAKAKDKYTLSLVEKMDAQKLWEDGSSPARPAELCGLGPVLTVMTMVKSMEEPKAQVLMYKNSFDTTAQSADRVVGYGAVVFTVKPGPETPAVAEKPAESMELEPYGGPISPEEKKDLMRIARESVEKYVKEGNLPRADTKFPRLKEMGAAFVTLKEGGQLRGCIGHVIAHEPLYLCVRDVACSAAKHDPRFAPVTAAELPKLEYEISVLSPMARVNDLNLVEVGKDGLLMKSGPFQGLLLPQVPTEQGWNRQEFLSHTCEKAGMGPDCWQKSDVEVYHFRAFVFGEKDVK
jgi:AmmeMemoRadiSam system protein B/AmmeMemoRadiSam system protein A